MSDKLTVLSLLAIFGTSAAWAQNASRPVPIYQVTVVERTVSAVNYQYRSGPTRIDFRGTVLLPDAKGDATVESKAGRVAVDARFEHIPAATRFGPEYLTYVLWAITPEGHAKNLGEVLAGSSDRAHLDVTTDFQTFGLIVTAEPYAAVRQPSNVVVLENQIRPDTLGHIEQVQAKYELLPRGHYTYHVPAAITASASNGEKLPMDRYEALLEVYQAQNAVQIARAQGADRYASDTLARAEQSLKQAQDFYARKVDRSTVVTAARQAAQMAEDARAITSQKKHEEEVASAKADAAREQQLRLQAEAEAQRARAQASADRMQLDQERSARERAEAEAAARAQTPQPAPAPVVAPVVTPRPQPAETSKTQFRVELLRDFSSVMTARDTPRGLVIEVPDADFRGASLGGDAASQLTRVASILAAHPGLYIAIEGNADNAAGDRVAYERAMAVRDALLRAGAPSSSMSARSLGASHPLGPVASQNRRVEITISGDPIGSTPYWDRAYSIAPQY